MAGAKTYISATARMSQHWPCCCHGRNWILDVLVTSPGCPEPNYARGTHVLIWVVVTQQSICTLPRVPLPNNGTPTCLHTASSCGAHRCQASIGSLTEYCRPLPSATSLALPAGRVSGYARPDSMVGANIMMVSGCWTPLRLTLPA